ncbi:tetratricopeptide repeat protein, partial [Saccharothrix coeruleofusca]|uniref:tetratricopeptide repeat protein n=1 Tax=Saccharothrix coeruleofusca TaxID=33919 RepID=UPI00166F6786
NLGEVAFRESDNDRARELFDQALPLCKQVGAVLGQANCLSSLGQVAFRESDNDQARKLFDQALPLYQRIRDRYSEAISHAWLACVTEGKEHAEHVTQMNDLAVKLKLPGFHDALRAVAEG